MVQPKPHDRSRDGDYRSDAPVLTPEESRQGVVSGRVVSILTTSLLLALIAFVILYSAEIV